MNLGAHLRLALVTALLGAVARAGDAPNDAASPPAPSPAPPAPYEFPARDTDLLALDPEMAAFFAARVGNIADEETRLRQIVTAILGADGLHFAYEPAGTYSAAETFRRRRGNCVSFSLLAVAVARAHGLQAEFFEVNTYPRWDRQGNLITEVRHVNVRVRTIDAVFELDLLPEPGRTASAELVDAVPDTRAFAHFYNNLAVLRVAAGDLAGAQPLFDRARAADPEVAFVWANQGASLVRAGDYAAAEPCLRQALRLDSAEASALTSLASLYAATGRAGEAAALQKKAQRYQLRNPYYRELLAQRAIDHGQYRDAETHLRRAIAIKDDEPQFYALRIQVAQALGRPADAARWTAKLQELRARRPTVHFAP